MTANQNICYKKYEIYILYLSALFRKLVYSIFRKYCEILIFSNHHHFVLFQLTSLLECAGEEPIEDIDIPVSGRYEDDFYINLLMAMMAMMAILAMMAMMA